MRCKRYFSCVIQVFFLIYYRQNNNIRLIKSQKLAQLSDQINKYLFVIVKCGENSISVKCIIVQKKFTSPIISRMMTHNKSIKTRLSNSSVELTLILHFIMTIYQLQQDDYEMNLWLKFNYGHPDCVVMCIA